MRPIPFHIVHDKQVQQSVVIYIHPRSAHRPQWSILFIWFRDSGFLRNVGKRSISVVVVQRVPVHPAHKNILKSIVVVIPDRHSGVVSRSRQSRFFRYITKRSIPIVAI